MKKSVILIFTCLLGFSACQQKAAYKVTGSIEGAQEGDTVKLGQIEGWDFIPMATTTIQNGEFSFTGRQDTADYRFVTYIKNGVPVANVQFVLENGKIQMAIRTTSFDYDIKGTATNEAWATFHNENERLCGESMKIYKELNDTLHPLDSLTAKQKIAEMEALEKNINQYRIQFCRDNIQNIAGAYNLVEYQKYFDPAEVAQLVAQIPDIYNTNGIKVLKEEIANKQKTSVGAPFLDFTLRTPEGANLSVAQIAKDNPITLVDFWASWCAPCRAEMPAIKAIYEKYHAKGFEVLGVSLDNNADSWKKAIADMKLTWPQISDLKGWECEGASLYGIRAIPATILIQNGKIIARDLRGEEIEKKLEELLK